MSGTEPFRVELWLPTIDNTEVSPIASLTAIAAVAMTLIILQR